MYTNLSVIHFQANFVLFTLHTIYWGEKGVTCVAFSPNGRIIASGGWDVSSELKRRWS